MYQNLSVLIVEDNDDKYRRVEEVLRRRLKLWRIDIERAADYEAAITKLSHVAFDVVVLDIMLPSLGEAPGPTASRGIVQRIHAGNVAGAPLVFGLTAHEDVRDAEFSFFSANMLNVLLYTPIEEEWAKIMVARIEFLLSNRGLSAFKVSERFQSDLCIIVARHKSEYLPICEQISWFGETFEGHPLFPQQAVRRGFAEIAPGQHKFVNLVCIGEKGMAAAASVTSVALLAFRPRLIAMLGICAGFNPKWPQCKLGDVVVASEAESWDSGRYEEVIEAGRKSGIVRSEFFPESRTLIPRCGGGRVTPVVERLGEAANADLVAIWKKRETQRAIPSRLRDSAAKPVLRLGQLVSGLSIVDSIDKREDISARFPSALALDMEVYGFYDACARSALTNTSYLAIKGVADFGDGKKASGEFDTLQPIISSMSWAALVGLSAELM